MTFIPYSRPRRATNKKINIPSEPEGRRCKSITDRLKLAERQHKIPVVNMLPETAPQFVDK